MNIKIRVSKSTDKIIGSLRVSQEVYNKIEKMAKQKEVSNQEIIRAILDEIIDKIEI